MILKGCVQWYMIEKMYATQMKLQIATQQPVLMPQSCPGSLKPLVVTNTHKQTSHYIHLFNSQLQRVL